MRLVAWIAAAFLIFCSCHRGEQGRPSPLAGRRVLAQNRYWAKAGRADDVFAWRVHATDVQVQMGLPRGRVFRGSGGDDPDVVWQIELTSEQAADFTRVQSEQMATFQPVMDRMATMLARFESSSYVEQDSREPAESRP